MEPISQGISRGQVWWIDFGDPQGSDPAFHRPAVVVQNQALNLSRRRTVMVVPFTSNVRVTPSPANVAVKASRRSGLAVDCLAMVHVMTTVNRGRLVRLMGILSDETMLEVDHSLLWCLDLAD